MAIKIVGIVGSPRKGNTETMVSEVLEGAKSRGANVEMILLRNRRINFYGGPGGPVHEDDMDGISVKLQEANAIVTGSPSYFGNVSGIMKNFIDRTYPLYETGKLKGRFLAAVAVGEEDIESVDRAADYLRLFGEIHGMKFVGSVSAIAGGPGRIREDEKTMQDLRRLGEMIVEVIRKFSEVKNVV
jgi:multimeric flavodoxin WrbA